MSRTPSSQHTNNPTACADFANPTASADCPGTALLLQIIGGLDACCPRTHIEALRLAMSSQDLAAIADVAEELVNDLSPRQLWPLLTHLIHKASIATSGGAHA